MTTNRRGLSRLLLALLLSLGSGSIPFRCAAGPDPGPPAGIDYLEPTLLTGTIYAKTAEPKEILFTFRRTATRTNSTVRVLREYARPDGTLAARERVVYEDGRLMSFQLEELPSGASGTAGIQPDPGNPNGQKIVFEYRQDGRKETGSERLDPDTLVNDMIGPFIAAHWTALMSRSTVRFRFAAITRAETVGFKLLKDSDTTWHGKPAVVIKMVPTSWIIARLVDPLFFTVEPEGQHRVLQYIGRTTPRIRKGNVWQDLDSLTVFDWR